MAFLFAVIIIIFLFGLVLAWPLIGIPAVIWYAVYCWRSYKELFQSSTLAAEHAEFSETPVNHAQKRWVEREAAQRKFFFGHE